MGFDHPSENDNKLHKTDEYKTEVSSICFWRQQQRLFHVISQIQAVL